jgi:hypothetical protein
MAVGCAGKAAGAHGGSISPEYPQALMPDNDLRAPTITSTCAGRWGRGGVVEGDRPDKASGLSRQRWRALTVAASAPYTHTS